MSCFVKLYSIHGACPHTVSTARAPLRDYQDGIGFLIPREGIFRTGSPTCGILTLFADVWLGSKAFRLHRHLDVRKSWDIGLEFGHRTGQFTSPTACAEIEVWNYCFSQFSCSLLRLPRLRQQLYVFTQRALYYRLSPYTSRVSSSCRTPRTPAAYHLIPFC